MTIKSLTDTEKLDWIRLIGAERVGPITFHQLIKRYGTAAAALKALPEIARRGGKIKPPRIPSVSDAKKELKSIHNFKAKLIAFCEPEYPALLRKIDDPPPVITVFGDVSLARTPCVAIVGSRNASLNGRKFTQKLAAELGEAGFIVVSGMARGIDAAAHAGSLQSGTIAVFAGGINHVYPQENRDLCRDIAKHGLIIAEQPYDTKPTARHFPRRNRIVSGLSMGIVVIEAAEKSGSLITARLAGEQGREVFAVPGSPLEGRSSGANRLLKDGAVLVETAKDILDVLKPMIDHFKEEPRTPDFAPAQAELDLEKVDTIRDQIIQSLGVTAVSLDELTDEFGRSQELITALMELELAGKIERMPGNKFCLIID